MGITNWLNDWLSLLKPQGLTRTQRWQDPNYRFKSVVEVQQAAACGIRIDVNQATVDDWLRLPGLSIHQARLLVNLNQAGVQFYSLEDIAAALNLPVQRLQPIAPILRFSYYDELITPARLDLNQATPEQLLQLPGATLTLAQAIVQERQQRGLYRNFSDLQQRLQLPGHLLADWLHWLRVG
jgi:DNA uptake protein ComE-like DNA-binding protein